MAELFPNAFEAQPEPASIALSRKIGSKSSQEQIEDSIHNTQQKDANYFHDNDYLINNCWHKEMTIK